MSSPGLPVAGLGLAPPTAAGFLNYVRTTMNVPSVVLPDNSPSLVIAFGVAVGTVNAQLNDADPDFYTLAVYNLGCSTLLGMAFDVPTAPNGQNTFWEDLRKLYNVNGFKPGVVSSASDVSTSTSIEVIEAAKRFTLANLQNLKDPWGRQYLAIAQDAGPSVWDLTP